MIKRVFFFIGEFGFRTAINEFSSSRLYFFIDERKKKRYETSLSIVKIFYDNTITSV